jgi:hypothetical protein
MLLDPKQVVEGVEEEVVGAGLELPFMMKTFMLLIPSQKVLMIRG